MIDPLSCQEFLGVILILPLLFVLDSDSQFLEYPVVSSGVYPGFTCDVICSQSLDSIFVTIAVAEEILEARA
tara:strand:+ start:893 stop:1108 length:216 start_codon:yes stop_codon:yes gene_type:complete